MLFLAGCTTALHIGKVPSALPLLRVDWQLSLPQAGLVLSIYALLIATGGFLLGLLVRRFSYRSFAVAGVGTVGVASLIGANCNAYSGLLITRAVEGLGWIMAAIAIPPLLSALSHPKDRPLIMGIWGSFVPVGAGIMLLMSPMLLLNGGWRFSWSVAGSICLLASILIMLVVRWHSERLVPEQMAKPQTGMQFDDLRQSLIWVLSGSFLLYSLQFVSVTSFLPTLLLDTSTLSLTSVSTITALVIISNALGNISAGYLLKRGISHLPLLIIGALGMGVLAFFVFAETMPVTLRLFCAFAFSILGGLIPGTCFATLPKAVSVISATGLLIGLMMQSAGVGQLLGGVVVPLAVDYSGTWSAAGIVSLIIGVAGALLAFLGRTD